MKKILILLLLLSSCNTFTYKSKYGYQRDPFKDYTGKHYIKIFGKKIHY